MTIMSKPYRVTIQLLGAYLGQLYMNPIRTKSLSAATIALLGNYVAQTMSGAKEINAQSLASYGVFGLLFGGTIPHFFYEGLTKIINGDAKYAPILMLLIERLFFMPAYQAFSLYTLSRFEFKSHGQALASLARFYPTVLEANFKYLTLLQFLNLYFVPPMLRTLVANIIGFLWVIFISKKRNAPTRKAGKKN